MKQFLYLDTDIVTSIIAQEEKGYVIQQTLDTGETKSKETEKKVKSSSKAKGSGGFWKFIQAELDMSIEGELADSKIVGSSTRAIVDKILHDASFDIAYSYITPYSVKINEQKYDEEGNYLKISRVYDFIDLDYLENLFSGDGIIEFLKKSGAEQIKFKIEEAKQGVNRSQLRKAGINIKNELKNAVEINDKQYDDIAAIIKAFRGLVPYNRMLLSSDGYLIPLDDKYFRIDPANLGFKYGGEMTCVGLVTNIIGESTDPADDKNIFATIQFTANEALRRILPTIQSDLCVIHPIAVYYGD